MKSIKEILMFAKTFFLQQKKKIILLLVIAFSTSILSTIQPNIFGKIIDQAVLGNKQELLVLIITLALVLIITTLLSFVSNKLQLKIGSNIEIELKKNVFNSILHLPVEKFSKLEKGQLMNNISEDINVFSNLFTTRFLIMIDFLSLFIMLFILMNINLFLTLILLINLPVSILLFNYYGKKINQSENQLKCFSDKLSTYIQEVFNGFSIIKTNTSESQFLNVYHKKNQNLYEFGIEKNTYSYLADFFSQQCNNILYIIVIGVGIILIGRGNMTIGELVAFSTYSSRLTVMLLNLTKINTEIEESYGNKEIRSGDRSGAFYHGRIRGADADRQCDPAGQGDNAKTSQQYDGPLSGGRQRNPDHRTGAVLSDVHQKRILRMSDPSCPASQETGTDRCHAGDTFYYRVQTAGHKGRDREDPRGKM